MIARLQAGEGSLGADASRLSQGGVDGLGRLESGFVVVWTLGVMRSRSAEAWRPPLRLLAMMADVARMGFTSRRDFFD